MKLRASKILLIIFLINTPVVSSQNKLEVIINTPDEGFENETVEIYLKNIGFMGVVQIGEVYKFNLKNNNPTSIIIISMNHPLIEKDIDPKKDFKISILLPSRVQNLSEVIINARKKRVFELRRLKDFEGTYVFAGKKSEVINMNESLANLSGNNSRQIYSQVAGLNIFQNDDAGLQLNIGGRGLDPNRSSNFNTRQNGYDISADVLGYPESYYTPPAEAIDEIQILRGAASLQYGTQFGGLVNFVMKSANNYQPLEVVSRNTIGSNNLYTNFTSISTSKEKLKTYAFINYKKGNGFRLNSEFKSLNLFLKSEYEINNNSKISAEITYLKYLAKQAGGLSDLMFDENPYQSNRSRNWFGVDWLLYNILYNYNFSNLSKISVSFFGLNASRNALGFRTNRVSQIDAMEERDLIKGDFNNFGFEIRFLNNYKLFNKKAIWIVGSKYYNSSNTSEQGPGSNGKNADFNMKNEDFPFYNFQSNYKYPNKNLSFFSENIIYLNEKVSITPGLRYEYIRTESDGFFKKTNRDAAGNVIFDELINNSELRKRNFILLGLGASYKLSDSFEVYFNISENYRSVTFADISVFNPAYMINSNISDESGSTTDIGIRGTYKEFISYDLSTFLLAYNSRIGFVQRVTSGGNVKSERGNVGDARILGFESIIDFNIAEIFLKKNENTIFNYFINFSFIDSKYTNSKEPGVEGKKVEFIPKVNLKTGTKIGFKDFMFGFQYTYLSDQFTDSSNAINSNLSGVIGIIPQYDVFDISTSYSLKEFKFESGINNLFNKKYFTRRATGYPGPGIIPSSPRTLYFTIQYKK
ncbi:MAG: Fe(3+) dicitrate transport protein [Candidatus Marivariicella framensis]|jgi:Fe(3+) dicitrate transport protein|tara:strand:+ start:1331 stop:3766 length:2436 start_codon:yes stop_codon:yes gene_type:complete